MTQPVTTNNPNMHYGESSAAFARRMGYTPGTILVAGEGRNETYLTITAVGEQCVLARAWSKRHGHGRERLWALLYQN